MNVNQKGQDGFETPRFLYKQLADVFNFTHDAACTFDNCLSPCGFYFDKGFDGLKEAWADKRIFCNPPFSGKAKWIEKAVAEVERGGAQYV